MTLIDSLRERPHHHKHMVAGGVAAGVTALLGGMWLMTNPFDASTYAPALAEGQAQVILGAGAQDVQPVVNSDGTISIVPSTTATPNAPAQGTNRGDVLRNNPTTMESGNTEDKLDQAQNSVFDNPDAQRIDDSGTGSWFTY